MCKSEARSTGERKTKGRKQCCYGIAVPCWLLWTEVGRRTPLSVRPLFIPLAKTWRTKVARLCDGKYLAVKTWKDSVSSRCKQTCSATPKDWPTSINADVRKKQKANVWYLVSQRQAKPIIIMASERLVFLLADYRTQRLINFWLVSNSGGRLGLLLSWSRSRFPNSKLPFIWSHCYDKHSLKTPSWS